MNLLNASLLQDSIKFVEQNKGKFPTAKNLTLGDKDKENDIQRSETIISTEQYNEVF